MPVSHLYVFFGKCLFRSSAYFLMGYFLILSCMSCLYMFCINPLSVISFANIFSQSVSCLFVWSMVSFAVQNLLSLIRVPLVYFCFCFLCLRRQIPLPYPPQKMLKFILVFHLFSSKSFMVSSLTFRSLTHFEFIFTYDMRKCSNFILLHVAV